MGLNRSPIRAEQPHLGELYTLLSDFGGLKMARPKSQAYAKFAAKTPPVRKPHCLNTEQGLAVHFFHRWGEELAENFGRKDLKRSFRRLALRLHPDRNPQGRAEFEALRLHFQRLLSLFKVEETQP